MQIDWWTLGLQALNALVLLWILARFFFKPVSEIMQKRQKVADAILAEAEAAKQAAKAAEEKAEAEAVRLREERAGLMEKAAAEAEAARSAVLSQAREQADKIRTDAETGFEALKEKEKAAAADHAGHLAIALAKKLFARLPESARVAGFIEGLSDGIANLPEETRNSIGMNGKEIRIKAVREMTKAEDKACKTILEKQLGRPVEFRIEVDPALIAGLELEAPHALVRNSFRADLERIEAELMRHA